MSRATGRRRGLPATAGVAFAADKRFRRSDVRPVRRKRSGLVIWRLVTLALVVGMGIIASLYVVRAFIGSSFFAVKTITVKGNVHLSAAQVEALVDGLRGESVWLVDFAKYRTRLMDSAWMADVSMSRVLPSTVEVRVVERVPLAVARLGQQLFLVDRAGLIIAEYDAQYQSFDLPVVDGLVGTPAGGDPAPEAARVALARRCLDALHGAPDLRDRVSQVNVANARDAIVMLDAETSFLHLGDDRFVERLHRYLDLSQTIRERFPEVDYVDLRFDGQVFVLPTGQTTTVAATKKVGN